MVIKILKKSSNIKLLFFLLCFINNIYYSKKYRLTENFLFKGRKYLNRCLNGKLNRKYFKKIINPKVTVIIPVYNLLICSFKYIIMKLNSPKWK